MENQSIPARILLYSTAAVILTIGMREIASILTTFFFSVFIALIFTPFIRWLKQKGIPGVLSVFLVILLFAFIVLILGVMVASAAIQFGSQIPIYQDQLIEFMRTGVGQFEGPLVWTRFGSRFECYYGFRSWKANRIILPILQRLSDTIFILRH